MQVWRWSVFFLCAALAACGGGSGDSAARTDLASDRPPPADPGPGSPGSLPQNPTPQPNPAPQTFNAFLHSAPGPGASLSGVVRLEIRGAGIGNAELLPATGYSPMYLRFQLSSDRTVAWADFDTRTLANGPYTMRISAFDTPPGTDGAQEIVVMSTRTWTIANAGNTPPAAADDPLYTSQWHLSNIGQAPAFGSPGTAGEDINIVPIWQNCASAGSCKGEGVTVAIVDTGIEISHPDLQANVSTSLLHRLYLTGGTPASGDPTPLVGMPAAENGVAHGTKVAGIVAARDDNRLGGRGVAPRASLVGYRLLPSLTDSNAADAMRYQAEQIGVSNNSWGPADDGGLHPASLAWRLAIDEGLRVGRGGRGTVYVWANGNGALVGDRSTYDGYASYRGVIAVGAVTAQGRRSPYSDPGANLWISAPGGVQCDSGLTITTTDLRGSRGGNNGGNPYDLADSDYTQCMNGTSAAAPVVSGVAALMLQANPALSWRDVRWILAQTARQNDASNVGWSRNSAGFSFNEAYGFGVVDANAAVQAARTWSNLPAPRAPHIVTQQVNLFLPDNVSTPTSASISVSGSGISRLEWVDVSFDASDHTYAGDLEIVLISPNGTRTTLAQARGCLSGSCGSYSNWRFGVARHLGEAADGTWRLEVRDGLAGDVGTFRSWGLSLYGH